ARPFTFVFNPGDAPRIVWRDLEEVQRLGGAPFTVRWFDADLNEAEKPDHPGRWAAYIEGRAPNGTPLRRAMTFFARPPGFLFYWPDAISATIRYQPGPIAEDVWPERQAEIDKVAADLVFRGMNDSEAAAVLLAGLSEAKAL